jgi:undecaprenyl-diphosphatase
MIKPTKERNTRKIWSIILAVLLIGISFLVDKVVLNIITAIQYPLLFQFFYTVTLLGEIYIYIWIAIILTAALMIYRKPITAFLLTLISAWIIQILIKLIVNRPRPFEALHINSLVATSMSSFPSGHAMMFFAFIPTMSKYFPKMKAILWIVAILVGFSRIYLGVHYFSDVIAGAILGYAIGLICMNIGEKYAWKY